MTFDDKTYFWTEEHEIEDVAEDKNTGDIVTAVKKTFVVSTFSLLFDVAPEA